MQAKFKVGKKQTIFVWETSIVIYFFNQKYRMSQQHPDLDFVPNFNNKEYIIGKFATDLPFFITRSG